MGIYGRSAGIAFDDLQTTVQRGRRDCGRCPFDRDCLDPWLRLRTDQIDMQQAAVQPCTLDVDALGQNEGALELTCGDPTVEEDPPL